MEKPKRKRRHPKAAPQPWGYELRISKRVPLIFQLLQRGPLTPEYLFELTKHLNTSFVWLQRSLAELYHGYCQERETHVRDSSGNLPLDHVCTPFTYLTRKRLSDYAPLVYDLNDNSVGYLEAHGLLNPYDDARRSSWWTHDFMSSCVARSIEIAVGESGERYISLREILEHPSCPDETRTGPNPLALPLPSGKQLVPDDLFGIEFKAHPKAQRFFYAMEIDRNTESVRRDKSKPGRRPPTIEDKLLAYKEVFKNRIYASHWGIRNLRLLIVTSHAGHAKKIAECAAECLPNDMHDRVAITSEAEFDSASAVPKIMHELYSKPWMRPGGGLFYLNRQ